MGHDIYSYKVDEATRDAYYDRFVEEQKEDFASAYRKYQEASYAGVFRRSAFDPLNAVIYTLLHVQELYGGCSGVGETRTFDLQTLKEALAASWYIGADHVPDIDTTLADTVFEAIKGVLPDTGEVEKGAEEELTYENIDLDEERQFLSTTIEWMTKNNMETIDIYFG